ALRRSPLGPGRWTRSAGGGCRGARLPTMASFRDHGGIRIHRGSDRTDLGGARASSARLPCWSTRVDGHTIVVDERVLSHKAAKNTQGCPVGPVPRMLALRELSVSVNCLRFLIDLGVFPHVYGIDCRRFPCIA